MVMAKKKPARRKPNPTKQEMFLAAITATAGNVDRATVIAKIADKLHYRWMKDPEYAERFRKAKRQAVANLETKLHELGMDGDVRAIIAALKAAKPNKYRERFEQKATGEVRVVIQHTSDFFKNNRIIAAPPVNSPVIASPALNGHTNGNGNGKHHA
jgi:hypothetical protein